MNEQQVIQRIPFGAAIFSLLCPPVGQLYAGRGRRFCVLLAIQCVNVFLYMIAMAVGPQHPSVVLIPTLAMTLFELFVIVDAFRVARSQQQTSLKRYQRWWIYLLFFVGNLVLTTCISGITRRYIVDSFVIPTRSMSPTIMAGDRMFVSKLSASNHTLSRGDVVVFYPEGPSSSPYVDRIVAIGGDTIEVVDEKVILNGTAIQEPYAKHEGRKHPQTTDMEVQVVPEDSFFVMGDNRRQSLDSRYFGAIPRSDYIGRAKRIYWSREQIFESPHSRESKPGSIRWNRIGQPIR